MLEGGFRLKTAVKEQDELLELVGETLERMLPLTQTDVKEEIKEDES